MRKLKLRVVGGFVKTGPDKTELRIHRSDYGPLRWSLVPPKPGTAARFRRWNIVLIAILIFLVLGAFVVAKAPRTAANTNAPAGDNVRPVVVQHANSNKSSAPAIHGRGGPGRLNRDAMNAHHTG